MDEDRTGEAARTGEATLADDGRPVGVRERIGRRAWVRSVALVGSGLIAGGVVAGTVTASAAEDVPADPTATQEDRGPFGENGWPGGHGFPGRPGYGGEELTGDTAAAMEAAVLAEYPDADIRRLEAENGGGYEAHIVTADGERLHVLLDEEFAITGTETRPDC